MADEVPGFQVAVVLDGELAYTGGWGYRGWESDEPVTTDTVFRWASVTKMHTATALLRLAEAGEVDLDASVTNWLPYLELAPGFDPGAITPRQLLTHTAALPDVLDWRCATGEDALEDYVRGWDPPLFAPPGSFYNYSNSGYTWAGALIERATATPYPDAMRELVLEPAGMATATFDAVEAEAGEHATGSGWWDGQLYHYGLAEYDCAPSRPAAWLHGTATDLARTAEWQLAGGGDVLGPGAVDDMHAQVDTHFWPDGAYRAGMGQFTFPYGDLEVVFHDGWVTGFVSAWAIVPSEGFGVAVVANADWADPYAVMYDAIELFLGVRAEVWPAVTTAPETWDVYTGTYDDPYGYGRIDVTRVGNRLYADFSGERIALEQVSGDYFYGWLDGEGLDVRFIQEGETYQWFVTRYGVGTRTDAAAFTAGSRPRARQPRVVREGVPHR